MTKFLLKILGFLLLNAVVLYGLQSFADAEYKKHAQDKFAMVLNHKVDAEIVMFGASNIYRQFNPIEIEKVTGMSAYNVGADGMFMQNFGSLLMEFITYSKQCKVVVIGCRIYLSPDALILDDNFYPYLSNKFVYKTYFEGEPLRTFCARYVPGYKFTQLSEPYYRGIFLGQKNVYDSLKGFMSFPDDQSGFGETPYRLTAGCSPATYSELSAIIDSVTSRGMKVVLVMPPFYQGYNVYNNAQYIFSKYKSLERQHVYFLNYYNDSMCYNRSNFYNYSHLNKSGADKFSRKFATDILQIIGK